MSIRGHGHVLKISLLVVAALGVPALIVLGVDRALPLLCGIPVYAPALSGMGPPNATVRHVSCDFDFTAHMNALGLRGPEVAVGGKAKFRIAVIGSSYTFGWGVNDDACFVRLLERGLIARGIDAEVVNLGRNGGAPGQYALLAEEMVPLLKPDLLIVAVGQGCDLEWSNPTPLREWLSHAIWSLCPNLSSLINAPGSPKAGGVAVPAAHTPTDEDVAASKVEMVRLARKTYDELSSGQRLRFDALEKGVKDVFFSGNLNIGVILLSMNSPELYTRTFDLGSEDNQDHLHDLGKFLHAIARAGSGGRLPTLVLSVPFGPYVNECAFRNYQRLGFQTVGGMMTSSAPDDAISLASGDLPFLSVTEAFRRQSSNPKLFFEYDLHMAEEGHALFCRQILPWVEGHVRAAMGARQDQR